MFSSTPCATQEVNAESQQLLATGTRADSKLEGFVQIMKCFLVESHKENDRHFCTGLSPCFPEWILENSGTSVCWSLQDMGLGPALWCHAQTRWQYPWLHGDPHNYKFPAKSSHQNSDACGPEAACVPCRCYMNNILEFKYLNVTEGTHNAIISIFDICSTMTQCWTPVGWCCVSSVATTSLSSLIFNQKTESRHPRKPYCHTVLQNRKI